MFAGWYANQAEYYYWTLTKDVNCVPIEGRCLMGFVVVQPRAGPVTWEQIRASQVAGLVGDRDLESPYQFGWYEGTVRVVDYARFKAGE